MPEDVKPDLRLVAASCFVRDGKPVNPGDPFVATDEDEFKRFLDREEAVKPKPFEPRRPETPEHRRAGRAESR